jgi:hypothetical protein
MKTTKLMLMKTTKLMRWAFCAAVLAAFGLVGCEKLDMYSIDSPSDLQHRIDSIAASKPNTGDTTYFTIVTAIVGAEDNSTGWNGAHSDYFTIPANKLLHLEFVNHGTGVNNWNNWNLAVNKVEANNEDYDPNNPGSGYFTLRSDAYGWGNSDYDGNMISQNYPDTNGDGDVWNDFRTTMQGAYVTIDVDHSVTGNVFVTATAVGTNGVTLVETYQQPVSATDAIVGYLVCDGSYFEIKKAYLIPSKVTVVEDVNPVSIAVTGAPAFVELGNKNFWGDATATVTYADGSSEQVDSSDISFNVIPDMTTLGKKTVVVAYSKTKQGAYGKAVSTYYNLEVTNAVTALAVTTMPTKTTYTFSGPAAPVFDPTGMVVTATYSNNTTAVIGNENLQFENPGGNGSQNAVITYVGATSTVTTTCPITNVMGGIQQVGAIDLSSEFWSAFSSEYNVKSGSTRVFTMHCYSDGVNNWNSPDVVLRKSNLAEYAVVRMDDWGWGDGFGTATKTPNWDWDVFTANINNSDIKITVTNVGDGTANIRYDITYANGDTHYQLYEGITVDKSDLNCAITIEKCYVNITSVE